MSVEECYDVWADQYDSNENRTRDMEALVIQSALDTVQMRGSCLEIGCGTGKNTVWLADRFAKVVSVDFSEKMLAVAQQKISASHVSFHRADITEPWSFSTTDTTFDVVTFSLMLEHIEDLDAVFAQVAGKVISGGVVYVGELHPFKQYVGSKARFETSSGTQVLTCFVHHVSDFTEAAARNGFRVLRISEHFDDDNRQDIPRILCLLLQKE